MNQTELKVKNLNSNYSIIIGNNILNILPKKIKNLCPKAEKIAIVLDKNVPKKYKLKVKKNIKKIQSFFI